MAVNPVFEFVVRIALLAAACALFLYGLSTAQRIAWHDGGWDAFLCVLVSVIALILTVRLVFSSPRHTKVEPWQSTIINFQRNFEKE